MKFPRTVIAAVLSACFLAATAFAAEASPAGFWKWTVQGRQGTQGFEQRLKLDYHDGKLSGTMMGTRGQFSVPDTPIDNASFKDGRIKFSITREFNGAKFTTKYDGKLEADTIKGTFERVLRSGEPMTSEWNAKRQN